jgi:hypothetical protein
VLRRFVLFLAAAMVCIAPGQQAPAVLDVQTYASPSGIFRLQVMPDDKSGVGPATYTLTKAGKIVWNGRKQYTLWGAVIANNGITIGYTYTAGYDSLEPGARDDIDVWRLAPNGADQRLEVIHRDVATAATDLPNEPTVDRLLQFQDSAVMVTSEHAELQSRPARTLIPTIRIFSISAGKLTNVFDAANSFGPEIKRPELLDIATVAGMPLLLTSWLPTSRSPATVRLLDLTGRAVWSRSAEATIAKDSQPSRFTIRSGRSAIRFAVRRGGNGYVVREINRSPLKADKAAVEPPLPPQVGLPLLQTIDLGVASPYSEVAIGPDRIVFADAAANLTVLDFHGRQLWSTPAPRATLKGDVKAAVESLDPDGACWLRTGSGEIEISESGQELASLAAKSYPLVPFSSVSRRASAGQRWLVAEGYQQLNIVNANGTIVKIIARNDRHWLGDIFQIDSAPDGSLAVLSAPSEQDIYSVSIFGPRGKCLGSFSLPKWLGTASAIQYDGRRVLVQGANEWACFTRSGQALWRSIMPGINGRALHQLPILIDGANQLATFDLDHTVRIYGLP